MKRAASAILLCLFLYNIVGYYLAFSILNWENNSEMSQVLSSSGSLETLRISKSELKNIVFKNGEKEIEYKGEMYDVKSKALAGDYVVLQCLHDKKEEVLLANLDDQTKNNIDTKSTSGNNHPEKSAQKNIIKDYFIPGEDFAYYNFSQSALFKSPGNLVSAFIVSLAPPPPDQV